MSAALVNAWPAVCLNVLAPPRDPPPPKSCPPKFWPPTSWLLITSSIFLPTTRLSVGSARSCHGTIDPNFWGDGFARERFVSFDVFGSERVTAVSAGRCYLEPGSGY